MDSGSASAGDQTVKKEQQFHLETVGHELKGQKPPLEKTQKGLLKFSVWPEADSVPAPAEGQETFTQLCCTFISF